MRAVSAVALALLGMGCTQPAMADVLLEPVVWLSAPTTADVDAAFPSSAIGRPPGYAMLRCQLEHDGSLSHCQANPIDGGRFDQAASSLVSKFRAFVPPDVAVLKDRVFVELRFSFQDPTKPAAPLELTDPQYVRTVAAAAQPTTLPPQAIQAGVKRGLALVECDAMESGRLSNCAVLGETPRNLGMGAEALAELSQRQLNLWQDARPVAGARLRIPFYIDDPTADADPASTREAAFHVPGGWSGTAGPFYPDRAERLKVKGSATIECVMQALGTLSNCVAVAESPRWQDFMAAALMMARRGAITAQRLPSDQDRSGAQVVRVTVPFRP